MLLVTMPARYVLSPVGSVDSLIYHIAGIIFFQLAGFMVDKIGVINTTLTAVIPLMIALLIFYSIHMDKRLEH